MGIKEVTVYTKNPKIANAGDFQNDGDFGDGWFRSYENGEGVATKIATVS